MFAKWSLRRKISASVALSLVLVGFAVSWLSYSSSMAQMDKAIAQQVQTASATFSKYVGDWFALKGKALESFPSNVDESRYPEHLQQLRIAADVDNVFLAFDDGGLVNANKLVMAEGNNDPRVWSWYINAHANIGRTVIEDPSVASATGKNVVSLGRAVVDESGELLGILGADVVIDNIVQQLRDIELPGNGYMFIATQKATVFAHTDQSLLNKPLTDISVDLTANILSELMGAEGRFNFVQIDGRLKQVYAKPIPQTELLLVMVMDREALVAPVQSMVLGQLIVMVILLVLITLVLNWSNTLLLRPLLRVADSLSLIASGGGDLTTRLPVTTQDEVGLLAQNFNLFADHLHSLVEHIRMQAEALQDTASASSERAKSSVGQLALQQQQIAVVTQSMDELSGATAEIARHAEQTASSVDDSVKSAVQGKAEVDKTRDSIVQLAQKISQAGEVILALNQNAQKINGIIGTIQGIAEQTNLLALNAAIEAARAGEQGRGFAVVADEVRVLSQRTHASTKEIQDMIATLQATAQDAVHIMQDSQGLATGSVDNADHAAESLVRINDAVGVINAMASQIATAAEQQNSVVHAVLDNITAIRQVADNTASDAHQSEDRANVLMEHAHNLRDQVASFRL